MTTQIIDPSIGLASLPSTYNGPGTLAASCIQSGGTVNKIAGFFTSSNNPVQVNAGFRPTKVTIVNVTDSITWEWYYGMPAADAIKNTIGTGYTLDTGGAITVTDPDSGTASNYTVTFSATAMGNSKAIKFQIES